MKSDRQILIIVFISFFTKFIIIKYNVIIIMIIEKGKTISVKFKFLLLPICHNLVVYLNISMYNQNGSHSH